MLRAVVFDFDGVIADDEGLHLAAFRHALADYGITLSESEYFSKYVGFDDHDGFNAILKDRGVAEGAVALHELMADKALEFERLASEPVDLFPGVARLLEDLRAGSNPLPLAIASGALRSEIELILGGAGLGEHFDVIVSAEDVSVGKPDPEVYRLACTRLTCSNEGLEPRDCLAIEDTIAGLQAASAAGMRTIAVTNSYPASELRADLVVDSLQEVDRRRCASLFGEG
ncbi:MAG: HAD family hydrolase [Candidatus Binatia bacterium]